MPPNLKKIKKYFITLKWVSAGACTEQMCYQELLELELQRVMNNDMNNGN